ncbi:MAG TPA: hypothetical protein VK715_13875, partial [Steroidobacteraceae bacterium]|nr:hypothetical protein [Steroidobacteraceae bacterium]
FGLFAGAIALHVGGSLVMTLLGMASLKWFAGPAGACRNLLQPLPPAYRLGAADSARLKFNRPSWI